MRLKISFEYFITLQLICFSGYFAAFFGLEQVFHCWLSGRMSLAG